MTKLLTWFYDAPIHLTRKVRLLDVLHHNRCIVKNYGELSTSDTRFDDYIVDSYFFDEENGTAYVFVMNPDII